MFQVVGFISYMDNRKTMQHRHLDDELDQLNQLLLEMSELVDEQLADAINAVANSDVELAERVRARDDEVDALELEIDRQCELILALHTPVAVDLRMIVTAVKLNTDLERVGDQAKNVAKNVTWLAGCSDLIKKTNIEEMADLARKIVREAQDSFVQRDRILARQVLAQDNQIDRLHKQTFDQIVELLEKKPEKANALAHLITMSKSIERIADHAKNIAEAVVFLIEGQDIRHRKLHEARGE